MNALLCVEIDGLDNLDIGVPWSFVEDGRIDTLDMGCGADTSHIDFSSSSLGFKIPPFVPTIRLDMLESLSLKSMFTSLKRMIGRG